MKSQKDNSQKSCFSHTGGCFPTAALVPHTRTGLRAQPPWDTLPSSSLLQGGRQEGLEAGNPVLPLPLFLHRTA